MRIAGELIHRASVRIENPGRDRAEDLHQVRVTAKRLRALLRLVRPVISNAFYRRENRRLKTIADRLSSFRDHTVSRQTFAKLAKGIPDRHSQEAFEQVFVHWTERDPDPGTVGARREGALSRAADSLAEANDSFENMLIPMEDWQALDSGLQQVYCRARNCMLCALAYETDEAFHEWRKQVKYLYYLLQMLMPIHPKRFGTIVRRRNRLEHKLGDDHDLAVLAGLLRQSAARRGGKRALKPVLARLERHRKKLRRETESLGRELLREKPRKFVGKVGKRWTAWRRSGENDALGRV